MQILAIILGVISITGLAAWLGEVIILNFIVIPALKARNQSGRAEFRVEFIGRHFPRFFDMATLWALTTVLAGLGAAFIAAFYLETPNTIFGSPLVRIAAVLIVLLAGFHLVAQSRLRPVIKSFAAESFTANPEQKKLQFVTRFLGIAPRIGLAVLASAFILLMLELLSGRI